MATILLIEDNLEIRENITEILELAGYEVIVAVNGKEGVLLATQKLPGLILCDIMMPELDGYQTFNQLKQNSTTSTIPFVFVTASVEKREIQTGLDMGAIGYIRKPFEPQELLESVKSAFESNKPGNPSKE